MRSVRARPVLIRSVVAWLLCLVSSSTSAAAQESHWLIVSGLGGEDQYEELFLDWGTRLAAAVESSAASVRLLAQDPGASEQIVGPSRKDNVMATLDSIASAAAAGDQVVVVLIGHGSFEQGVSRINLPGPDMTDADFAVAFEGLAEQQLVFVNTASASGGFVATVSAPGRTVLTATKTGGERNQTRFAGFFVEALESDAADQDKNGRISTLEAFQYARRLTLRTYEDDNKLATEHALLDDNGDGKGSEEPARNGEDGGVADRITLALVSTSATPTTDDPVLRQLFEQRSALETRVADLRELRDSLDPEVYQTRLEALLLELAQLNRQIQLRGGGNG